MSQEPVSPALPGPALPPRVLDSLVATAAVTPAAVSRTALRGDADGAEELIARLGSRGAMGHAEVLAAAATRTATPDGLRSNAAYALGLLAGGRSDLDGPDGDGVATAADLLALGRRLADRDGSRHEHVDLEVQTSFVAGHHEHARALAQDPGVDSYVRWAIEVDRINPWSGTDPADHETWLHAFNQPLREHDLVPVRVDADVEAPFDTLRPERPVAGTVDGPLVSIIVPTWRPTESLLVAVGSLVAQSWANLQVIVVDDASGPEYADVFRRAVALDPRVEYLLNPVNGGAYKARNLGLSHARGEVLGIQDADDWSHPQRIERQMRMFDADGTVVATLSKAIRLHADLRVTRVGSRPLRQNAPSLLVRADVHAAMGRFDDVRKAADTEFIQRLETVHGPASVPVLEEPLALYQLTEGSLSRADFRLGWHKHSRFSYHSAFRHWHARIAEGTASPFLGDDPQQATGRPFPAPPEIAGTSWPTEPYDVVVLADWRGDVTRWTGLAEEVAALADAGLSVGLSRHHAVRESLINRRRPPRRVSDLVADGRATWVPLAAPARARTLLVRDPELLNSPPGEAFVGLSAEHVVVVADQAPRPEGSAQVAYEPAWVEATALRLFGATVTWLPATEHARAGLLAEGAAAPVLEPARPDVVRVHRFLAARHLVGRPVVGTCDSSVFASQRVDPAALAAGLPDGSRHDVRVLGRTVRVPAGSSWLVQDLESLAPEPFMAACDVYVGLPTAQWGPSPVRPVLEAMAVGCVPLLDPVFAPFFGDAVTYLEPGRSAEQVDALWADPAAFARAQARALAFCETETSARTFAERVVPHLLTGRTP